MRRGVRHSGKSFRSYDESDQVYQCDSASVETFSAKNLSKKKEKNSYSRTRSASVHEPLKEPKSGREARKMHSPLPTPHPMDPKLPLRKFYKLYSKIVLQLDTVKLLTESKRNESENLVDLRRQLQRADEFSIRFSRNNLYETKRIINEIGQLLSPYPYECLPPGHSRLLFRKIILAYQAASQALQSYINYAKNPSNLEVPHKINELVLLIADLLLCCENVSFPLNDACIKNDAVKVCNDLIKTLKSKVPVCEYVEPKEPEPVKSKPKKIGEEGQKFKKLSMYKTKLTPKLKMEALRKKHGVPCMMGTKPKKSKKDEKKAKITHDIYTQKLNPWQTKSLGNKLVKFEAENQEKLPENPEEQRPFMKRHRHMTPREVRSQDDDVVTMVQAIGDDETSTCRMSSSPRGFDEDGELNQNRIKELLEAIEGLRSSDKKEQKLTLKNLLHKIENCTRAEPDPPEPERVKVYHFLSEDLLKEQQSKEKLEEEKEEKENDNSSGDQERHTSRDESGERKLKSVFKPLVGRKSESAEIGAKGNVTLKISEKTMRDASKYRKAFSEFRRNNIMYKKTLANKPWKLVGKVSDQIILDIIKEISLDFESDALLTRLYLSELQEVTS